MHKKTLKSTETSTVGHTPRWGPDLSGFQNPEGLLARKNLIRSGLLCRYLTFEPITTAWLPTNSRQPKTNSPAA
jgi:hypothetical protein